MQQWPKILTLLCTAMVLGCWHDAGQKSAVTVFSEAGLKDFVMHMPMTPADKNKAGLDSILKAASPDSLVFRETASFLESPFGDPNSRYRDEQYYALVLKAEIRSKWYSDAEKKIIGSKLKLLAQNDAGNAANDFTYITPDGHRKKMYDLHAKYTLLLFYNPECGACKEMKSALSISGIINKKFADGELKLLAVYTDNDQAVWRMHLSELPAAWIAAMDENEYLYKNKIYDLRAVPTIYLLDKDKKVILKDCTSLLDLEAALNK